jgi:cytoskeletal protein RodZ
MPDLAGLLRGARQDARLSLQELASRTKIKLSTLEAMERGDFAQLPGGVFMRGFLRACAHELGLDPDVVLRSYSAEYESPAVSELPLPTLAPRDPLLSEPTAVHGLWRTLGAAAALLILVILLASDRSDSDSTGVDTRPVATTGAGVALGSPVASPALQAGNRSSPVDLSVTIHAKKLLWIEATADGRRILYQLMQQGERETVSAREQILLRIGDASAIEYFINGKAGRTLGPPGAVRSINVTPANAAQFLR